MNCNRKNWHQMVEIVRCHKFEHWVVHITTSLIWNMPFNNLNRPHVHGWHDEIFQYLSDAKNIQPCQQIFQHVEIFCQRIFQWHGWNILKIFFIVHVHRFTLTSSQYNVVILQTKTYKGVGGMFQFWNRPPCPWRWIGQIWLFQERCVMITF